MDKFLIIGLGNPGEEYAGTRHNIGYDVLEAFVAKYESEFRDGRYARVAEVSRKGRKFICIQPTTFMNLSGRAVRYWLDKGKIAVENSLTIVDDLALPLDRVRLRKGGSDAGHNGLKDIQEVLGTDEYPRLRFGVGDKFLRGRQIEFVLSRWPPGEVPLVREKINQCSDIILDFA